MTTKSKKHNDTAVRALEILKILTNGTYTKEEIIEKLIDSNLLENEIRPDALYKYGNTFRLFNLEPKKVGEKYTLDKLPFSKPVSDEEKENISLLLQYAQIVLDKNSFEKIKKLTEKIISEPLHNISETDETIKFTDYLSKINSFSLNRNKQDFLKFKELCKSKQKIQITYRNRQLNEEQRFTIEPIRVKITPSENILEAYNSHTYEIQDFYTEDIIKIEQLPSRSPETHAKSSVTFKISGRLALSYEFKPGERLVEKHPDCIIVSSSEEDRDELLKRLLKYSKACEILNPKTMRTKAANYLNKIKQMY